MQQGAIRETVDLQQYPDLVMVLLGFRAHRLRAIPALLGLGKGFAELRRNPPDGLLGEVRCLYAWNHLGIRQYWRDLDSLEQFTRTAPHRGWWRDFLKDPRGAGLWHEVYSARGGVEAMYISMPEPTGLASFAPIRDPVGTLMSGRERLRADLLARTGATGARPGH